MTRAPAEAEAVVSFWRLAGTNDEWFARSRAFDASFAQTFHELHFAAARGECASWVETAPGALALMVLLDQYPRNAFRGTGHMYATDGLCRAYAREAEERGHMARAEPGLRLFFCLPFAHSEQLSDQDISVTLNGRLGEPWLSHAEGHRGIIRCFGRFPHRNRLLGRQPTEEELRFLDEGGFSG